jgi:hypothetical protein
MSKRVFGDDDRERHGGGCSESQRMEGKAGLRMRDGECWVLFITKNSEKSQIGMQERVAELDKRISF